MHQRWGINPSDLCESDQFVTMRHLGHLNSVLHAFVWYLIACTVITQCNAQQPGTTCKRLLWFAAIGPEHVRVEHSYYHHDVCTTNPVHTRTYHPVGNNGLGLLPCSPGLCAFQCTQPDACIDMARTHTKSRYATTMMLPP